MSAPRTAREMLSLLDKFFVEALSGEANRVWLILSGSMRGPDSERASEKALTHELRARTFPRCVKAWEDGEDGGGVVPWPSFGPQRARLMPGDPRDHFHLHVSVATDHLDAMDKEAGR